MIFWKLHIPPNTDLSSMIDTSYKMDYNIWLTNEVTFEISCGKIGELEIPKNDYSNFLWIIPGFFLEWDDNNMTTVMRLKESRILNG